MPKKSNRIVNPLINSISWWDRRPPPPITNIPFPDHKTFQFPINK